MTADKNQSDLLSVARTVLRDDLLAALPGHLKYEALMVANAMAISSRELALGAMDVPSDDYSKALSALLSETGTPDKLTGDLITQLRQGAFHPDHPKAAELHQLLLAETRRKVKISNPRALDL